MANFITAPFVAAGEALGLSAPDLSQYGQDIESQRRMREQFLREYGQRGIAQVGDPALGSRANTVGTQQIDPSTGQVSNTEQIQASNAVAAGLAPVERPGAAGYNSSGYQAVGFDPASIAGGLQRRARQEGSLDILQGAAEGRAPSVAELQLRQGLNDAGNQQRSLLAAARGSNLGLATRQAARNLAYLGQGASSQAALIRAGEMAQARGQYANAVDAARGQDIGVETTNAGYLQDARRFTADALNQAARFGAAASNDAAQFNTGAQNTAALAGSQAANEFAIRRAQLEQEAAQANAARAQAAAAFNAGAKNNLVDANAGRALTVGTTNAGLAARAGEFNVGAQNERDVTRAQLRSNTDQFNAGAQNADRTGLRNAAIGAATNVTAGEANKIDIQEAAKKRRTELISNAGQSVAKASGAGF